MQYIVSVTKAGIKSNYKSTDFTVTRAPTVKSVENICKFIRKHTQRQEQEKKSALSFNIIWRLDTNSHWTNKEEAATHNKTRTIREPNENNQTKCQSLQLPVKWKPLSQKYDCETREARTT